ncbi:30S ribosomal protein S17 [Candidatus Gottesmanbacteria bacterium]|nr:30S ribosomal protein S17 [Candidatus Gottesmanbacteria bacterium]
MNKPAVQKKEIVATVLSTSMNHTVIVSVARSWRHPVYKKAIRRTKKLAAHVEGIELHVGDTVKIVSTKPISKTKKYKVISKV